MLVNDHAPGRAASMFMHAPGKAAAIPSCCLFHTLTRPTRSSVSRHQLATAAGCPAGPARALRFQYAHTFVAAVNRHLQRILGAPPAIQNDPKPSGLAALHLLAVPNMLRNMEAEWKTLGIAAEELLAQLWAEVRECNYEVNGPWVST
jgi:hypothetical protein